MTIDARWLPNLQPSVAWCTQVLHAMPKPLPPPIQKKKKKMLQGSLPKPKAPTTAPALPDAAERPCSAESADASDREQRQRRSQSKLGLKIQASDRRAGRLGENKHTKE